MIEELAALAYKAWGGVKPDAWFRPYHELPKTTKHAIAVGVRAVVDNIKIYEIDDLDTTYLMTGPPNVDMNKLEVEYVRGLVYQGHATLEGFTSFLETRGFTLLEPTRHTYG